MPRNAPPYALQTPRAIPARYRVQVLDRAFRMLDALAASGEGLTPADIAGQLCLHKSTIHRLLVVLESQRFIRKTAQGKYGLGTKLIEMGSRAVEQLDLGARAQPYLQRLVDEAGETAHICVLTGTEMVSIANVPGRWTLRTPSTVGRRTQIHCTAIGKAFIAFLPEHDLDALLSGMKLERHTPRSIVSVSALKTELARVRRRGFAVDDEEAEAGLRCIGAPVRNYTGGVVASISIAGPVFRIQKGEAPALARLVVRAADDLSIDLGYVTSIPKGRRRVS